MNQNKLRVFTLRMDPETGAFDDRDLVAFLEPRELVSATERFFVHDGEPVWAVMVTWRDPNPQRARRQSRRRDWLADVAPTDRPLFDALRDWRNQAAKPGGKPAYTIFNNTHLLEITRRRPSTLDALSEVPGVGQSRVKEYGQAVLQVVAATPPAAAEPSPATPPDRPESSDGGA